MDKKNPAGQAAVSKSLSPNLKPWAAYVLGHDCLFIRRWQVLHWQWGEQLDASDGPLVARDQILEALGVLSEDLPEATSAEIATRCQEVVSVPYERPVAHSGQLIEERYFYEDSNSIGYQPWNRLLQLSRRLSGPFQDWGELGNAIADFRLELATKGQQIDPGKDPSLKSILRCCEQLYDNGWQDQLQVSALAFCQKYRPWLRTQEALATAIDTSDEDVAGDRGGLPLLSVLSNQMNAFDQELKSSLRSGTLQQLPEITLTQSGKKEETFDQIVNRKLGKMPSRKQIAILNALKKNRLTKEELAKEISREFATRIYKPRGLTELMDVELVKNDGGGNGYYLPDDPPVFFSETTILAPK